MLNGFCRTRPSICPRASAADELLRGVEADELHLAREARLLQREQHAEGRRLVGAEDAVDAALGGLLRGEEVLAGGERALGRGAAVLVVADDLDVGVRLDRRRGSPSRGSPCSPSPPGSGARRPCPCRRGAWPGARPRACPRARLSVATKLTWSLPWRSESKMTTGIFAATARLDRAAERLVVERREHDAGDALRDEALHDVDLALRSSSLSGPFQTMSTSSSLRGLHRAGVDGLPELVRRPLGDHRDGELGRPPLRWRCCRSESDRRQRAGGRGGSCVG